MSEDVKNENINDLEIDAEINDLEPKVRFEVGGKLLELDKVNRVARRLLEGQAKKYRGKYKDVIGTDGSRPVIVIRMVRLMDKKVEIVLEYPESMKDSIKNHEKAERIS